MPIEKARDTGEVDGSLLLDAMDEFEKLKGTPGYIVFSADSKKAIREVIAPYWQQRGCLTAYAGALPEETRFMNDPEQERKP